MSRTRKALSLLLAACLLVVARSQSYADEYADEDDEDYDDLGAEDSEVVELDLERFTTTMEVHPFVLVEFYAPWCGHCKALAPAYAAAASILASESVPVILAKVDATVETQLAEEFNLEGYPTFKWFVNGKPQDYKGGRSADDIVAWVKAHMGPAVTPLDSGEQLEIALKQLRGAICLAHYASTEDAGYKIFESASEEAPDVIFFYTAVPEVAALVGLTTHGVVMVRDYEFEARETVPLAADSVEDMAVAIKAASLPLVIPFEDDLTELVFSTDSPHHIMVVGPKAATDPLLPAMRAAAEKTLGKVVFVTVDSEHEEMEGVLEFFSIPDGQVLTVKGFRMEDSVKFAYPGQDVTEASLVQFASLLGDGTAEAEWQSEDIPEKDMEDGVKVVVGKSFESVVLDTSKDVFLEVYAPWCQHCKDLEGAIIKLAKRFSNVDTVVIAKMDGTKNETPIMEVEGFPTLVFFPGGEGGTRVGIPFDGERTLLGFTKFIKEHAKFEYELPKKADEAAGGADGDEGVDLEADAPAASHDEL